MWQSYEKILNYRLRYSAFDCSRRTSKKRLPMDYDLDILFGCHSVYTRCASQLLFASVNRRATGLFSTAPARAQGQQEQDQVDIFLLSCGIAKFVCIWRILFLFNVKDRPRARSVSCPGYLLTMIIFIN